MNKNIIYMFLYIFISIIILYIFNNYYYNKYKNISNIDTVTVVDTIRHVDTIKIVKKEPQLKYKYITKTDTLYKENGEDTILITEQKTYQDTLCNKNDSIILLSYITGQNAKLDSIKADWRKSETTVIKTIEITKYIEKPKTLIDHFKVGVGVGYGIGIKSRQFEPYAGISFNYVF